MKCPNLDFMHLCCLTEDKCEIIDYEKCNIFRIEHFNNFSFDCEGSYYDKNRVLICEEVKKKCQIENCPYFEEEEA